MRSNSPAFQWCISPLFMHELPVRVQCINYTYDLALWCFISYNELVCAWLRFHYWTGLLEADCLSVPISYRMLALT